MILPMLPKSIKNSHFLSTIDTQNRYLEFIIWITLVKQELSEDNRRYTGEILE